MPAWLERRFPEHVEPREVLEGDASWWWRTEGEEAWEVVLDEELAARGYWSGRRAARTRGEY